MARTLAALPNITLVVQEKHQLARLPKETQEEDEITLNPVRDVLEAYEIERREFPSDEVLRLESFVYIRQCAPHLFWGAYVDGQLAAYLLATLTKHSSVTFGTVVQHQADGINVYIQSLATSSEFRGRGIGHSLIKHFVKYLQRRQPHIEHMFLLTHQSLVKFYEKVGFCTVGPSVVALFGKLDWIEMQLDLLSPTSISHSKQVTQYKIRRV